jgi:hypothetical protein
MNERSNMTTNRPIVSKEALEMYRSRWQLVAEIEAAELQRTTIAQRLQQLNTLFQLAVALQIYPKAVEQNRIDAQPARDRWLHLKTKIV